MRAGRDPHRPLRGPTARAARAPPRASCAGSSTSNFRLPVTLIECSGAPRLRSRCASTRVCAHSRSAFCEHRARDARHAQVAAQRRLRHAAVHEQQANPPPPALGEDVRPELRLGDHGELRAARDRGSGAPRPGNRTARSSGSRASPNSSRTCSDPVGVIVVTTTRVLGVTLDERRHERGRRAHLAHGNGVHPEHAPLAQRGVTNPKRSGQRCQ